MVGSPPSASNATRPLGYQHRLKRVASGPHGHRCVGTAHGAVGWRPYLLLLAIVTGACFEAGRWSVRLQVGMVSPMQLHAAKPYTAT